MKKYFNLLRIETRYKAIVSLLLIVVIILAYWNYYPVSDKYDRRILGIGDTLHTWEFTAATAGDYTYNSSEITVDNAGARVNTGASLIQNPGFEVTTNEWTFDIHDVDLDAQSYWDAMVSEVSEGRRALDHNFISNLKSQGIWQNLDEIWVFAQESQQAALLGMKRYQDATNVGSTPFTVNQGFQRDSGSKYINTNFTPGTNGVNYSTNNASFGFFTDTNSAQSAYDMSTANSGEAQTSYITARWSDGVAYVRVNHNGVAGAVAVASSNGFFVARRTSSSQETLLRDGTIIINRSASSSGLSNFPFAIGARNVSGAIDSYTTRRYKLAFVGSSMTEAEQTNFSTTVNNYLSSVSGGYDEDLFMHETSTTYNSSAGAALVNANLADHVLYQTINVGNDQEYILSAYVYTDGSVVANDDVELYYNDSPITTNYTSVGDGWYQLTATITGANSNRDFGLQIKANQTAIVDNVALLKKNGYELYTTNAYQNTSLIRWENFAATESIPASTAIYYQLCDDDGDQCQADNLWKYWNGTSWNVASNNITDVNTSADLTDEAMENFPATTKKISVKVLFEISEDDVSIINDIDVGLSTDTIPPVLNASATQMANNQGGYSIIEGSWANNPAPYFSWTAGTDDLGGSGLLGYCLYLGTDSAGDPATTKGLLGTSPISTTGSTCGFIIDSDEIDFANLAYRGDLWIVSDDNPYYLNIKAIDNAGNIYVGTSESFEFFYDDTAPKNVDFINPASGTFNGIADMNFSWPLNGSTASSDAHSDLLGWQYAINSTDTWLGTETEPTLAIDYIPIGYTQPHHLDETRDGSYINVGDNVIYFRTVDNAGNSSSTATYRTGNISYGGNAPIFPGDATVVVNPSTNTSNSFQLSWPAATAAEGNSIESYYYMINASAPATLDTLIGNSATYIPTSNLNVPAGMLQGAQRGSNQVRVVAVDNEGNYSPSNSIVGNFILNSTNPDPAINLTASDASIKAASLWRAALAWDAPTYQGTGVLTYIIQRSNNGSSWVEVATTSGNAYVDTVSSSQQYYWRIGTVDTSDLSIANPSFTNAVTLVPRGAYTEPAALTSEPNATGITTRKVTINWTTSRSSDSKIAFGTTSGEYNPEEISNSAQTTNHTINITNLLPGTTYYYVAKWTDEDGNTGISAEKTFTTSPAPSVESVKVSNINLSSATISYTVRGASAVRIYFGQTNAFGGMTETLTSTQAATYNTTLNNLQDGQLYYFKVNPVDTEGIEYQGTVLDFSTLPRPRISNVQINQVRNTAQPTILISWDSNTEVSSVVSYNPEGNPSLVQDEVDLTPVAGAHEIQITSLLPETTYELVVRGTDVYGNQAISDLYKFTTATDTRPPLIYDLRIEGSATLNNASLNSGSQTQLIVSWKTDEPATSQIEFGEGSSGEYLQKTQREENLKTNHLVVISGLSPSKVYHLRAISVDAAGNSAASADNSVITPKAPESALNLVIKNLLEIFGFLR